MANQPIFGSDVNVNALDFRSRNVESTLLQNTCIYKAGKTTKMSSFTIVKDFMIVSYKLTDYAHLYH